MNRTQQEIQRFISVFKFYEGEIRRIKEEKEKTKTQTENIAKYGSLLSKSLFPQAKVTQKGLKRTLEQSRRKKSDPLFRLKLNFNRDFHELEDFLDDCLIQKYDGTKTSKKPSVFISTVMTAQTVETRVKRVLDSLNRLALQGDNLILAVDYVEHISEEILSEITDANDKAEKTNLFIAILTNGWLISLSMTFDLILIIASIFYQENSALRVSIFALIGLFLVIGLSGGLLKLAREKNK